jgi:hypothetical protein
MYSYFHSCVRISVNLHILHTVADKDLPKNPYTYSHSFPFGGLGILTFVNFRITLELWNLQTLGVIPWMQDKQSLMF